MPTVSEVKGTGQSGGGTPGNEILDIYGNVFGPVRSGAGPAADIIVKYGSAAALDSGDAFTATSCRVVTAGTWIRCLTAPGYGMGHMLTVTIGDAPSGNNRTSAKFAANIRYASPIVAVYSGPGAVDATTYGNQLLVVSGANFGPAVPATPIELAEYGEGDYQLEARDCRVTVAHTEITCTTSPGAGVGLKLVVTIAGQKSTIPAISYGRPEVKSTSCVTDSSKHGTIGGNGDAVCSCDRCAGVNSSVSIIVPALTVGDSPSWCRTDEAAACTIPTPTQNDVAGKNQLSTRGYQIVLFSGINFGRVGTDANPAELESVTYGGSRGTEIIMPVLRNGAALEKSVAACRVHEPSFSVACNTRPGIAGPHKWIITVRGQSSTEIVETNYAPPNIEAISPAKSRTDGGTVIQVIGTEFGIRDEDAKFKIVLTRGAPSSSCFGIATLNCHELPAYGGTTLASGKEQVEFNAPESFGASWNVRLIVSNKDTNQSTSADFLPADVDARFGYSIPEITSVEIEPSGTSALNTLTIKGQNFCNRDEQGCGSIFLCDKNASSNATAEHCYAQSSEITNTTFWSHDEIISQVATTHGFVFIRVGAQGATPFSAKSGLAYFSTDEMTIVVEDSYLDKTSFTVAGGSIVYDGVDSLGVPTAGGTCTPGSAGTTDSSCLMVTVTELPDTDVGNPSGIHIKVGSGLGSYIYQAAQAIRLTDPNAENQIFQVKFASPHGSGASEDLRVCYGSSGVTCTQNAAKIKFAKPVIEDVRLDSSGESIYVTPGILPTAGANVTIVGRNLACDPSLVTCKVNNELTFRWQSLDYYSQTLATVATGSSAQVFSTDASCTSVGTDHATWTCTLPPSEGTGYTLYVNINGQTPETGSWPGAGRSVAYAPPRVLDVTPDVSTTRNPGRITVSGRNFGHNQPTVMIDGSACVVDAQSSYHSALTCVVADGEGKDHVVVVTAGGQSSLNSDTEPTFSYAPPVVSSFTPETAPTSGMNASGMPVVFSIRGSGFGRSSNRMIFVNFETVQENRTFTVEHDAIFTRSDSLIEFNLPAGFGELLTVSVTVREQTSAPIQETFGYEAPSMATIRPNCGSRDNSFPCYGSKNPGFDRVEDYPKILSVVVSSSGRKCRASLELVKPFPMAANDTIQLAGVGSAVGQTSGLSFNFNGQFTVTRAINANEFEFNCPSKTEYGGLPEPGVYLGWNVPPGNLRALAAKSYISADSAGFKMLETDGCSTQAAGDLPTRSSYWESFGSWLQRKGATDATDSVPNRQCSGLDDKDYRQTIVIEGLNFGSSAIGSPIRVTMKRKTCDCSIELDGSAKPCKHLTDYTCAAKDAASNTCPKDYEDCSTSNAFEEPRDLEIKTHEHDRVEVYSVPGFGRRHMVELFIGSSRRAGSYSPGEEYMRYQPPTVTGFETPVAGSEIFRPDGESKIIILGHNLGYGSAANISGLIEVRIGVEYDQTGVYCAEEERCMKLCKDLEWFPMYEGGGDSAGFPYVECKIPKDIAGYKNISLRLAGQIDSCATNRLLCGLPINFPSDRRMRRLNSISDIGDLLADSSGTGNGNGLAFTCARSSDQVQSYARPGELCETINNTLSNQECADDDCTKPKAKPGFWRLDLDLQFRCNEITNQLPCQNDVTGEFDRTSFLDAVAASFTPFDSKPDSEVCFAGIQSGTNATLCKTGQFQCDKRGGASPGMCLFRRPLEARRALGSDYWPFACPGTDLQDAWAQSEAAARSVCNTANPEAFQYVDQISQAGCPRIRTNHLINYTVYDSFPALDMSTTCYDITACNPKTSCLGDNKCNVGYEYQQHRCELWNALNPESTNCTTDDQCRTRSGRPSTAAGLGSACDDAHPEDCSRCVIDDTMGLDSNGARLGTCECQAGGPRCGICRRGISTTVPSSFDPANHPFLQGDAFEFDGTKLNVRGYRRLNDECQECPDNPALLMALMGVGIVLMCIGAWWMEDKNINVAFLSIGIDYFQVLAIFARIKISWPYWVKQILEILSIFNFNIDIAAPECLIPEFDYKTKWIIMMLLPVVFGGILLLIFFLVLAWKCVKRALRIGGKVQKFCSHANKLVAVYIIVFYFIYLTVTRRALDIFNCNPPDPPDGYYYTEFSDPACPAGLCVCDTPNGLQTTLKPWATLGLIVYSIGFPVFTFYLTWFYRVQMKLDQLLRAHGLGESREEAISAITVAPRRCRSRTKKTYELRKKFHKLYYHFKPGKVYWMLVILARKFGVALFALMFRRNVAFLLSCVLLLLFASYVLQVRHRPYMSTVEREAVKENHRLKAHEAELMMVEHDQREVDSDLLMHHEMQKAILQLMETIERNKQKTTGRMVRTLSEAARREKDSGRVSDYYFDYNTVEQVLIACSIFLSLVAIMFESGQFYQINPQTGMKELRNDPTTEAFYTAVLVMGGTVLIGSLVYYAVVFMAEVIGHVPGFIRMLFASKKTRMQKKREGDAEDDEDEGFEMADVNMYANPLKDLEKQKAKTRDAERRAAALAKRNTQNEKQKMEMVAQMKRLKQDNARNQAAINHSKAGRSRTPRTRKEMGQQLSKTGE
jgi:hypothetical protein